MKATRVSLQDHTAKVAPLQEAEVISNAPFFKTHTQKRILTTCPLPCVSPGFTCSKSAVRHIVEINGDGL